MINKSFFKNCTVHCGLFKTFKETSGINTPVLNLDVKFAMLFCYFVWKHPCIDSSLTKYFAS